MSLAKLGSFKRFTKARTACKADIRRTPNRPKHREIFVQAEAELGLSHFLRRYAKKASQNS